MTAFIKKQRGEILNQALDTLTKRTPITARSPGSIARSLVEAFSTEIGDLYDVLDYNISQSVISTATGDALDNIGSLFGVKRFDLTQATIVEAATGSFYFYLESAHSQDIVIPEGTMVFTDIGGYVGSQIRFTTAAEVTLTAGRKKVYVPLLPSNGLAKSSVGADTLIRHNATSPIGVVLKCTNPRAISAAPQLESDNDFRLRITKQIRVNNTGTAESMRFAVLTVPGVRDVIINSASYGLGGVEVVVVPSAGGITTSLLTQVKSRLDLVRPVGVRVVLSSPTQVSFDMTIKLFTNRAISDQEKTLTIARVENDIKIYLNSLMPNEPLVYNRLIQKILDVSDKIKDVQITRYAPNGIQTTRTNYQPGYNEQIIPGNISVSFVQ